MKTLLTISFGILFHVAHAQNTFNEKAKAYVAHYAAWAIEEQQRVGIPAAITLAQGIYETGAGESELATEANNHFGIKCKKEWTGETFAHTDDAPNECFRKYPSAKESYKDHSDYLKNSKRYAELFTYDVTDYDAWAKGLKRCGYATNPAYAGKLKKMVEDFELQQYTLAALGKRQNEIVPIKEKLSTVEDQKLQKSEQKMFNGLKAVYCQRGENLLEIATQNDIRYARLLEINELPDAPLSEEKFIYLEPKKVKGIHETHIVAEGETVATIAYTEAMSSRQLRIFNLLAINEEPIVGSVLYLQNQSDIRPETYKTIKKNETEKGQTVRLISDNKSANDNDYLPTKKSIETTPKQEMKLGTERVLLSGEETKQNTEEVNIGYGAEPPAFLKEEIKNKDAEKAVIEKPKETEEPMDEFAKLKAKLDQAVYSKTSKSNIKVSSEDAAAIHGSSAEKNTTMSPKAATEKAEYYTVQKGDTGYGIAKKYGISIKQLNEWNGLNFEGIKIGQKLRVK